MKVLVIGSESMLAQDLLPLLSLNHELLTLEKDRLDIVQEKAVKETISRIHPDWVINCAAYTKVDRCESEKKEAFNVNAKGPYYLAEACRTANAKLVHFSTDYIFDGGKGASYVEDDTTHPLNVYGASKLEGELLIQNSFSNYLIIRTQWLYGTAGHHFVKTIARLAHNLLCKGETKPTLKIVEDQWGSPTYTVDLARAVKTVLDQNANGIYHVTNAGYCSWKEFAEKILYFLNMREVAISGITTEESGRPAKRPSFAVLDNRKLLRDFHFTLPPWEDALFRFISEQRETLF